jgi:glutamate/tyrosine decarboxylase-like PLP-dependent enzyme
MHDVWSILADEIRKYERDMPGLKVTPTVSAEEIRRHLRSSFDFSEPHPLAELTTEMARMLRRWNVQIVHPRHFGLFNPSVRPAGVVADTLTALFNPQLGAWWYSPGANEIELHTLDFFLKRLGFDPGSSAAHFTSGGSEANMSAVLVALTAAFPAYAQDGLAGAPAQPTIYLSEEAHDSFAKIAHHAGLGRRALRRVKADANLRLDPADLTRKVNDDRKSGKRPFLVVGTAGTTGAGGIDPLPQLGTFCRDEGLWFHVDAAWGGGALLSPRLRDHLQGIEGADSVTWDAHKWLPVPTGAGMFFCKDREVIGRAFAVETGYVPDNVTGTVDLYKASLLWSRRFIGLKVFMTLAELGSDGIAALVEHQAEMGDALRARLRERGWRVVNDSPLPLVCFTHPAIRAGKVSAGDVVARMLASEGVWLSKVRLRDEDVLRACVTSYMTQPGDVGALVEQAERAVQPWPT